MDPAQFLEAVFGKNPPGQILIWALQSKYSVWSTDPSRAGHTAAQKAQTEDVYTGVGLAHPGAMWKANQRVRSDDVYAIPGLVADIDVLDPVHKKTNLPPDIESAIDLAESMPLEPTLLVHSGHGLQAWWLFDEPWVFLNEQERAQAQQLLKDWNGALKALATESGWDVDAVWDLARVMRIPGTLNHKGETAVSVTLLDSAESRYTPTDVRSAVGYIEAAQGSGTVSYYPERQTDASTLNLDANAQPPGDKFWALQEIEPRFYLSWERTRKDLTDKSPSAYDFSLASFAAQAGWSDQEITDLLIASRRKHGDDLKLRQDYYFRTVTKARESLALVLAEETLDEPGSADCETIRSSLAQLWGLEYVKFVRYAAEPAEYMLESDRGTIKLGDVAAILDQNTFRKRIADLCSLVIPRVKQAAWDKRAQAILECCEHDREGYGPEATRAGRAEQWIDEYLSKVTVVEDLQKAAESRAPFWHDGYVHVFGKTLRAWLAVRFDKISPKELGEGLRAYGASPTVISMPAKGGKRVSRKVWKLWGMTLTTR